MSQIRKNGWMAALLGLGVVGTGWVHADYVSTAINRVFLDPASVATVADGVTNGEIISFIFETTPELTGDRSTGAGAWATVYLPPGAEVVGVSQVQPNGSGGYAAIPAKSVDTITQLCGQRGCGTADTAGATRMAGAQLRQNQQDSGIFYSTDARTALLTTPLSRTMTGSVPSTQNVWNTWDGDQILAFGTNSPAALSGNAGKGTTRIISFSSGAAGTWVGTGSPVAGPDTYFTNDYNPNCAGAPANADITTFQQRSFCVGPWQRIQYPNSRTALDKAFPLAPAATGATTNGTNFPIGSTVITLASAGSGAIAPGDRLTFAGQATVYRVTVGDSDVSNGGTITITPALVAATTATVRAITLAASGPSTRFNPAASVGTGHVLSESNPLPATTKAIRFVQGARVVGDLETARVTLRVTDATALVTALNSGTSFCLDATGGDASQNEVGPPPQRGAIDNIWRYYEGNNHTCFTLDPDGVIFKRATHLNAVPGSANSVSQNDIIGYDITYTNTGSVPLTNVVLSDAAGSNLELVAAGTSGCPYSSYTGTLRNPSAAGPTVGSFTSALTTWNAVPSLAIGQSVTVTICGRVTTATAGAQVINQGRVVSTQFPTLKTSSTLSTVNTRLAGMVYCSADGNTTLDLNNDTFLIGFPVTLRNTSDVELVTNPTSTEGRYEFNSLVASTAYRITKTNPAGMVSVGATTVGGTVINADRIDVNTGTASTRDGNIFFVRGPYPSVSVQANPNEIQLPNFFDWTFTLSNAPPVSGTGGAATTFASGQVVFTAQLPSTPTYGTPTVNYPGGTTGTVSCSISAPPGNVLSCQASGGDFTINNGGSMNAVVRVTPTVAGQLSSTITVDPAGNITQCNEAANNFTVNVGAPVNVPVTISDVAVSSSNGMLSVDFGTAAQIGTLGFRVLGKAAGAALRAPLDAALTMGAGSSLDPQRYRIRVPHRGETEVWIEEVDVYGVSSVYGPYAVGSRTGEVDLANRIDWSAIDAEQRQFRAAQQAALRANRSVTALEAELKVDSTGLVVISHERLLEQGIDWSGTPAAQLRLFRGTDNVPFEYEGPATFGPGSVIRFIGEAITDSIYTRTNVYRLAVHSAGGEALHGIHAGPGSIIPLTAVRASHVHAPKRGYDNVSPHTDPWYARRLTRVNEPLSGVDEVFTLADRSAQSAGERIELEFWGGLDLPSDPDHHVRFLLNGTLIGSRRFDGLTHERLLVDLPSGLLNSGSNTLRMELIGDTGEAADLVYLYAIRVDYLRELRATGNRIAFEGNTTLGSGTADDRVYADDFSSTGVAACRSTEPGCVGYEISGLGSNQLAVYRARASGVIERLSGVRTTAVSGGQKLAFAVRETAGDRYWVEPLTGAVTASIAPRVPVTDPLAGGVASYLIISHPSFMADLTPLILARRSEGFTVRVVDVEHVYDYYSRGVVDADAIAQAIRDAHTNNGTRYVLLVGADTFDYFNYLGANSRSYIPTNYRATGGVVRFAPVDSPYADPTGDHLADVAIGRFPVRTIAEVQAVIEKTLTYAQGPAAGKFLRVADRSSGGVDYDSNLGALATVFGPETINARVDLDDFPVGSAGLAEARAALVNHVNQGQALVAFHGHSAPSTWTQESLLTASQVHGGIFSNTNAPTVAWVLGCYGSFFTSPTFNTVSQALMVQSNGGGAAAVIGTSGLTKASSNLMWMAELGPRLSTHRVGEAIRLTQRVLRTRHPDYQDVEIGTNLLGDPALRIR